MKNGVSGDGGMRGGEAEGQRKPGSAGRLRRDGDVAAPAITGAKLLGNGLENVTFTGRQL